MNYPISEKMRFRHQFVLGPSFIDDFPTWQQFNLSSQRCITAHPDLNICHAARGDKSLTLLGYIIDPDHPPLNDTEIINNLLDGSDSLTSCIEATYELGGRWVLIYKQGDNFFLFHDCAGLRMVHYTHVDITGELWCVSQPGLIADALGFGPDRAAREFINQQKSMRPDHRWPGDSSAFKEFKRLQPNHYLDLHIGKCFRYWPSRNLDVMPPDFAIEKVSKKLQGLMQAGSQRFQLALGLSSGWDSRLALAACRNIADKLCVYNGRKPDMPLNHPDIVIPRKLAQKFKIEFHCVPSSGRPDADFQRLIEEAAPDPIMQVLPGLRAELNYFKLGKVGVTGNILETARCDYYLKNPNNQEITPKVLAKFLKMDKSPFGLRECEKWLAGLGDIFNINILDLFHWEQSSGSWFAANCLAYSIAWQEVFLPVNCRSFLADLLAVDPQLRKGPDFPFFRDLIHYLWPGLLSEPINPSVCNGWRNKIKSYVAPSKIIFKHKAPAA